MADPSMAGGGGGAAPPPGNGMDIQSMIQQQVQVALQGMGGGGAAGGAGGAAAFKPKIDENVVLLQILKMLAQIVDHFGIQVSASSMVVTPTDLQQQAMGGDPSAGGSGVGAGGQSLGGQQGNMMPVEPIQPIEPAVKQSQELWTGVGFPASEMGNVGLARLVDKADMADLASLAMAGRRGR
jgi:hypothetical protein